MKKIKLDVMTNGGERFYIQLTYMWNDLFKFDYNDVWRFVLEKCPTLKYEKDVTCIIDVPKDVVELIGKSNEIRM